MLAVPLVTVMSLRVNPVTDSLKVKVTGIGEMRVPLPTVVDTVTVVYNNKVSDDKKKDSSKAKKKEAKAKPMIP